MSRWISILRAASNANLELPQQTKTGLAASAWRQQWRGVHQRTGLPIETGRPKLVILGTGWGGAGLVKNIDDNLYDITVISPRNHMVFTPLLASTTVGTLESRSVAVNLLDLKPSLGEPQHNYFAARAREIDPDAKIVHCEGADGHKFTVPFDDLVVATGSQASTFGIKGVEENAHFLLEVSHAQSIRKQLIQNITQAALPGREVSEYNRLLHCVIIGGGPIGVEFAGELCDFINKDLRRMRPQIASDMKVTLVEGSMLLGSFDANLRLYALNKLMKQGVHFHKGVVSEVEPDQVHLNDGTTIPYGLLVWATGVGPTPFISSLPYVKTAAGRLAVDAHLRLSFPYEGAAAGPVQGEVEYGTSDMDPVPNLALPGSSKVATSMYAIGDCCANPDKPLPPLAQVAEQQGKYLAAVLNAKQKQLEEAPVPEFKYRSLGSMASLGDESAVIELHVPGGSSRKQNSSGSTLSFAGFLSWVAWRSAYLTRLGTVRNRLYVMVNWTTSMLFGRDTSRW